MAFDRITVEPDKFEGRPCIRGLRITVETVVRLVAAGWSFDQILDEYPDLERADIQQALEYAAGSALHLANLSDVAFRRESRQEAPTPCSSPTTPGSATRAEPYRRP